MKLKHERNDEALLVDVEGRLDDFSAKDFRNQMKAIMSADDNLVVLDFAKVKYISSAGLRSVLLVAQDARKHKSTLRICSLESTVREVFRISGFDQIIELSANRQEALEGG